MDPTAKRLWLLVLVATALLSAAHGVCLSTVVWALPVPHALRCMCTCCLG